MSATAQRTVGGRETPRQVAPADGEVRRLAQRLPDTRNVVLTYFDLDRTLAMPGEPLRPSVSSMLSLLQRGGMELGLASGWNTPYLMGVARGANLENVHIIAENGAVVRHPVSAAPHYINRRPQILNEMQEAALEKFHGRVWPQGNDINVTLKPTEGKYFSPELKDEIIKFFEEYIGKHQLHGFTVVKQHPDSVEGIPDRVGKGKGVEFVMSHPEWNRLGRALRKEEVAAVGDGPTDESMYEKVGLAIRVKNGVGKRVKVGEARVLGMVDGVIEVPTAHDALALLLDKDNRWHAQIRPSEGAAA